MSVSDTSRTTLEKIAADVVAKVPASRWRDGDPGVRTDDLVAALNIEASRQGLPPLGHGEVVEWIQGPPFGAVGEHAPSGGRRIKRVALRASRPVVAEGEARVQKTIATRGRSTPKTSPRTRASASHRTSGTSSGTGEELENSRFASDQAFDARVDEWEARRPRRQTRVYGFPAAPGGLPDEAA